MLPHKKSDAGSRLTGRETSHEHLMVGIPQQVSRAGIGTDPGVNGGSALIFEVPAPRSPVLCIPLKNRPRHRTHDDKEFLGMGAHFQATHPVGEIVAGLHVADFPDEGSPDLIGQPVASSLTSEILPASLIKLQGTTPQIPRIQAPVSRID